MQTKSSLFVTGLYLCTALATASGLASRLFAKPAPNAATATYVTTAEIDAALKQMPPTSTTYDKPIKTVDTGAYKVTIVVLRRIPSNTPDSALLHDRVTEVYQIISGAGMFETGGMLVDGKPVDLTSEAAGPSVRGTIQGGEEIPWYSITDGFDTDFGVNEWHGHNVFFRDGERVFRTYFINNRGDEAMGTTWSYLDLTPLGRQETWEDSPEGYPQAAPYKWWNWHDNYDAEVSPSPKWVDIITDPQEAARKRAADEKA